MTQENYWRSPSHIRQLNGDMVELPKLTPEEEQFATYTFAHQLHLTWGLTRMARGFVYGPSRTETEHPNLVQHEDLPEEQQRFDEEDAVTTLRVLKALGLEFTVSAKSL
jgi:hypothetical protein